MKKIKLIFFSAFVLVVFLEFFSFLFFKQITSEPFDYSYLLDNKLRREKQLSLKLEVASDT